MKMTFCSDVFILQESRLTLTIYPILRYISFPEPPNWCGAAHHRIPIRDSIIAVYKCPKMNTIQEFLT